MAKPPHLHRARLQNGWCSRIITGCSVHARNVWGLSNSLLIGIELIEASLDDRQQRKKFKFKKEWNG